MLTDVGLGIAKCGILNAIYLPQSRETGFLHQVEGQTSCYQSSSGNKVEKFMMVVTRPLFKGHRNLLTSTHYLLLFSENPQLAGLSACRWGRQ